MKLKKCPQCLAFHPVTSMGWVGDSLLCRACLESAMEAKPEPQGPSSEWGLSIIRQALTETEE